MKRTLIHDIEIYKNYCLIGFQDIETGEVWSWEFEKSLTKEERVALRKLVMRHQIVGFNSRGFDLLILFAALQGYSAEALKRLANEIIMGKPGPNGFEQRKSWDIERSWDIEIPKNLDHIDLIEVAPGKASLKIYNGRLHGRRMQDLPIAHDAVLTDAEKEIVYDYWLNDLEATKLLYKALSVRLDLRTSWSKLYKTDLRSKSDAQIAEAIIKTEIEKITGQHLQKSEHKGGQTFKYEVPHYIRFHGDQLNDVLDKIEEWEFRVQSNGKVEMPDFLSTSSITLGDSIYRMGIGGLHSSEERISHEIDDDHALSDHDVTGFYPQIIITLGLFPERLGKIFLKVYKGIVDRRTVAKRRQQEIDKELKELEKMLKECV